MVGSIHVRFLIRSDVFFIDRNRRISPKHHEVHVPTTFMCRSNIDFDKISRFSRTVVPSLLDKWVARKADRLQSRSPSIDSLEVNGE